MVLVMHIIAPTLSTANMAFSTSTEPFLAARWARVLPSLVVEETRLGRFSRKSWTRWVWSFCADRWIGFWSRSSFGSIDACKLPT